jgi:hypothetical protein
MHRDNAGLRLAMHKHIPLVYFYGLVPGKYATVWPIYIVGDDPKALTPKGEPWVSNGISLCKLHHAAFDAQILGIRPDLVVEIRKDILEESDGPLLVHGLKEWHNKKLIVIPHATRHKPKEDFLEERFELFKKAG